MIQEYTDLMLQTEQEKLFSEAIKEGLQDFQVKMAMLDGYITVNILAPWLRTVCVNQAIYTAIKGNPELGMTVEVCIAGAYHFLKVTIPDRNLVVLLKHLPTEEEVPDYSEYRAQFCGSNQHRLQAEGKVIMEEPKQLQFNFGDFQLEDALINDDPLELPFCLVVTYDGRKGADTDVFQGALTPDLAKWIFKSKITNQSMQPETSPASSTPPSGNGGKVVTIPLKLDIKPEDEGVQQGGPTLKQSAPGAQTGRKGDEESGT
ncbi:MAG TPA: hypothetical protein VFV52_03035 [Bacilli bacterium]|nr:hypothetical protein [Bacilli bacterium]